MKRFLGIIVVLCVALLGTATLLLTQDEAPPEYTGSAVVHDGIPYTLSFETHKKVVAALNEKEKSTPSTGSDRLILYRLNEKPLEIYPLTEHLETIVRGSYDQ